MAPKGLKRSAPTAAGSEAKRAQVTLSQFQEVAAALEESRDVPAPVAQLLGSLLPMSLGMPQDKRHSYQAQIVGMVAETLEGIEAGIEASMEAAKAKLGHTDEEKAKRQGAMAAAQQALAARHEEDGKAAAAKAEASVALKAKEEALSSAKAAQETGDKELVSVEGEKAQLEAAATDVLAPLKASSGGKPQVAALLKALKPFDFDASLILSLHLALHKEPAGRTAFDQVILEHLDAAITQKVASFDQVLAAGASARAERAAVVAAAQDAADEAKKVEDAAQQVLQLAGEAQAAAQTALESADKALAGFSSEMLQTAKEVDDATQRLKELRAGALATFRELSARVTPPPALEQPEEPETLEPEVAEPKPETAASSLEVMG